jgi:hypothetical protein
LLKPVVPLSPAKVKDNVVEIVDWIVAIVTLDIWRLVTFPLIVRSTVVPLSVLAFTVVSNGFGEDDGVGVAFGVLVGFGFDVDFEVGVGVDSGVGSGVGVGAFVTVNKLLTPMQTPSVTVILTSEPGADTITEEDPTPLTKAFMVSGLIEPAETVKDGLPI